MTLCGQAIDGPSADRGMVFQSYTLFPWLTVRENVMFGPKLKHLPKGECEAIADRLIAAVHLNGFERSYPEEVVRRHAPARGPGPRPGQRPVHSFDG